MVEKVTLYRTDDGALFEHERFAELHEQIGYIEEGYNNSIPMLDALGDDVPFYCLCEYVEKHTDRIKTLATLLEERNRLQGG